MIHVLATIDLHPGTRAEYLTHFRDLVPLVLAEDGCLAYAPAVDIETGLAAQGELRPDAVTVVEQWRDVAALKAHLAAPHLAAFREKAGHTVRAIGLRVVGSP